MKNVFKLLGITMLVLVIGFTMAACGGGGGPGPGKMTYQGKVGNETYTLVIEEATQGKAAYTPEPGDIYTLTVGNNKTSKGTVDTYTPGVTPKFTLKPSVEGASTFTVSIATNGGISGFGGSVTWDGTAPEEAEDLSGVEVTPVETPDDGGGDADIEGTWEGKVQGYDATIIVGDGVWTLEIPYMGESNEGTYTLNGSTATLREDHHGTIAVIGTATLTNSTTMSITLNEETGPYKGTYQFTRASSGGIGDEGGDFVADIAAALRNTSWVAAEGGASAMTMQFTTSVVTLGGAMGTEFYRRLEDELAADPRNIESVWIANNGEMTLRFRDADHPNEGTKDQPVWTYVLNTAEDELTLTFVDEVGEDPIVLVKAGGSGLGDDDGPGTGQGSGPGQDDGLPGDDDGPSDDGIAAVIDPDLVGSWELFVEGMGNMGSMLAIKFTNNEITWTGSLSSQMNDAFESYADEDNEWFVKDGEWSIRSGTDTPGKFQTTPIYLYTITGNKLALKYADMPNGEALWTFVKL